MENISGEETARLLRRFGTVRTVPKGTLLSGKEAYWLLGGICALTCVNESGSQYSFLYFHRNMLFGFVPVLGRYYRMNRLVDVRASRSFSGFMAKTDCSVIELPANAFLSEITRDREVLSVVLRAAVVNLADMLNHSMVIASLPVPCRVCYMLLEACPEEEPYLLPAYLNYDEIAAHLGVHVITVTKIFGALYDNGIMSREGRRRAVLDKERLLRIVQREEELPYLKKRSSRSR